MKRGNAKIHYNVPYDMYAAIPALNASLAKEAVKSVSKACYSRTHQKPRTQGLLFGTYYHTAMLEPHNLPSVAIRAGDGKTTYSTRSTGKGAKEWLVANPGRVAIDDEDFETCMGMVERLKLDGYAFGAGWVSEAVIVWTPEDGVPRKARIDGLWLGDGASAPKVLEVKSCESCDADDLSRAIANYGYHIAAEHYCQAVEALTGQRPEFHFLAQEKDAPHDWLFSECDEHALTEGRAALEYAAAMWKATDGFMNPRKVEPKMPATIGLPGWYKRPF